MKGRPPKRKLSDEKERQANAFISGAERNASSPELQEEPELQEGNEDSLQKSPPRTSQVQEGGKSQSEQTTETSRNETSRKQPSVTRNSLRERVSGKADQPETYPWEEPYVRQDVKQRYPTRLPEPLYLKLKYISSQTGQSMNSLINQAIEELVERALGPEIE